MTLSNTPKFVKPLLEQKSNKNELSYFKTVENIETKDFETFSLTKFQQPIDFLIDHLVEGQKPRFQNVKRI